MSATSASTAQLAKSANESTPAMASDAAATPKAKVGDAKVGDAKAIDSPFSTLIVPFVAVHILALAAPFIAGFSWKLVALALAMYYVRMAAITIGYHRYFAHKAFKTSRAFQFVLAFLSQTSMQRGVLWWTAHHRDHHRYSDTEKDVHSPMRGIFWSHVGWILSSEFTEYNPERVKDLSKYPELRWLNTWHLFPTVVLGVALFAIGGWSALVWGLFVSTVMLWHGTFLVNSLNHIWGTRRYATTDTSKNNALIAVLTMGEGWHNNHHHHMASARQGFFWWEIDGSFYLIKLFQLLGLVWDAREPSKKVVESTIKAAQARGEVAIPLGGLIEAE